MNKYILLLVISFLTSNEIDTLKEALARDPENGAKIFQLAEKYRAEGSLIEAIPLYQLRIEKEGDKEEIWASKYALGECFERTGIWSDALFWYLEAFQENATRPAPLLNIATYYRSHGENDLAYLFCKHGSRIQTDKDYLFDQELSIVAYYTRFKEEGYRAASDLVIRKETPPFIRDQGYRNLLYYVQNLKNTRFQPIEIKLPPLEENPEQTYHPMNPSIMKTEDGYAAICRAVNYTQTGARDFFSDDPQGYIKTKNFLVFYTPDFKLISQHEIIEDLLRERFPTLVQGLEDCRLFRMDGHFWFTCTTADTNPARVPQISLCKLKNELGDQIHVETLTPLWGPDPYRCEKNWLPFVQNDQLHVIYCYDPFTVYIPDIHTGECDLDLSYEPTNNFTYFKGSAAPIPFDDGYLALIHETVYLPDATRVYLHRFIQLDRRFYVKQISKPFTFVHQGIEFCTSMTMNHAGTEVILALGLEDTKAYLCFVDLKTVRSMLYPNRL